MSSNLSPRGEDYLKTLSKLLEERKEVGVSDLAEALGVKAPSAVGALAPLKERDLVRQPPYGALSLSEEGRSLAARLRERERLLRLFFGSILDLPPEEAEVNACSIEHYISPTCLERFVAFIAALDACPRGRPGWLRLFDEQVRGERGREERLCSGGCTCGRECGDEANPGRPDPTEAGVPGPRDRVRTAARARGFEPDIRVSEDTIFTVADAARTVGAPPEAILKSLILVADRSRRVLALMAGENRMDLKKIRALVGARSLRMATPEEVFEWSGFRVGGVPPIGFPEMPEALLDEDLYLRERVWAAAGDDHSFFPIEPERLRELVGGRRGDISRD